VISRERRRDHALIPPLFVTILGAVICRSGAADEPIVSQTDIDSKTRKVTETQDMLNLLGPECEACKAQSTSAIEVLKQHLDKCVPSVHGQQALSNAFMQVCTLAPLFVFPEHVLQPERQDKSGPEPESSVRFHVLSCLSAVQ
jgi:hypothetical protein